MFLFHFLGGKDSTVLLHIVRELYPNIEAVFVNTGLEYPEIQKFVKTFNNVTILRPKMRFDDVIKEYGYPLISKDVSLALYYARKGSSWAVNVFEGLNKEGIEDKFKSRMYKKYKPLINADFPISSRCCYIMKERPLDAYAASTQSVPIISTTAEESKRRENAWLKTGCNAFNSAIQVSKPLSFWREQDILKYIKENNIPIASVYGDIVYDKGNGETYDNLLIDNGCKLKCSGAKMTGCIFCMFGAHCRDDNRFVRLKQTHPKQYAYCMNGGEYDDNGVWKPNKDGLGMKHVIDEVNSIYGKDFIKY